MNTRQSSTHPSMRGAAQETNLMQVKYAENDSKANQTLPQIRQEKVSRGENEVNAFPVPV